MLSFAAHHLGFTAWCPQKTFPAETSSCWWTRGWCWLSTWRQPRENDRSRHGRLFPQTDDKASLIILLPTMTLLVPAQYTACKSDHPLISYTCSVDVCLMRYDGEWPPIYERCTITLISQILHVWPVILPIHSHHHQHHTQPPPNASFIPVYFTKYDNWRE